MIPKISMYNLASLDGRIDWIINSPETMYRYYTLAFHWRSDAILIGSNTLVALGEEDPNEAEFSQKPEQNPPPPGTEHLMYEPKPLLVIVDSSGRVHNYRMLQKEPWWRDMVVLCSKTTPQSYLEYLCSRQVNYIIAGDDHVDIRSALEELNRQYGVITIRTDTGGVLNGILLREGLVDEVSVLIGPMMIGGTTPKTIYSAQDLSSANDVVTLKLTHMERIDEDYVWLTYDVIKNHIPQS
ncbi:MAG: RibD family protein [Methanospirillum sp.]|uniref:RibD family protein n=1 Tax=Methanospirillum sp. TaxID=45200 RepID=UPI00236D3825|nr:RibD family protein [Methanospirillum sp.]MDD1730339.1 RibD family protein [Methanospirillum sp.]